MFKITAWNEGIGYNVEVDEQFALTLRDSLTEALEKGFGNSSNSAYEIHTDIKND